MKGHLGFVCRPCLKPAAPSNLRQGNDLTLEWDAPQSYSNPITNYIVERYDEDSGLWVSVSGASAATFVTAGPCLVYRDTAFRVRAQNACGIGPASEVFSSWQYTPIPASQRNLLFAASDSFTIPCWFHAATVWCIGAGGTAAAGGRGGPVAKKTFYRGDAWGTATILINPTASSGNPARTQITLQGQTVTAYAAVGQDAYQSPDYTGADEGWTGNSGGTANASFSQYIQYSGWFYYGGSIGGTLFGESPPGRASPCQRMPARDRGFLLQTAHLAGEPIEETCAYQAAFGSGGVRVPYPGYGMDNYYFLPSYGGGGFDQTCPGGPGCVLMMLQ